MGGKCQYDDKGVCKRCKEAKDAAPAAQQQAVPMFAQQQSSAPFQMQQMTSGSLEGTCPATMGGQCHFVGGKCTMCERQQ